MSQIYFLDGLLQRFIEKRQLYLQMLINGLLEHSYYLYFMGWIFNDLMIPTDFSYFQQIRLIIQIWR